MRRRWTGAMVLGAAAGVVGLALLAPIGAGAQERDPDVERRAEEREARAEEMRRRARVQRLREHRAAREAPLLFGLGARGGYLGIRMRDVDDETVSRLGLPSERGVLVEEVTEESPAEEAGLRPDDVIVSWNGERVESAAALSRLARETPPGRSVRLGVVRDGREREVTAELDEPEGRFRVVAPGGLPEIRMRPAPGPGRAGILRVRMRGPRLGVSVIGLTDQLGEHFGVEGGDGVLVARVLSGTPADAAGLRAGDVILSVAGEEVDGPGDISRILRDREPGPVEVRISRERQERSVTVELEAPEREPEGAAFHWPHVEIPDPPAVDFRMERLEEASRAWAERMREWTEGWEEAARERAEEWEARLRALRERAGAVEVLYRSAPVML